MATTPLQPSLEGRKDGSAGAAAGLMSIYTTASATCDGPALPSFVRFNESHLPSAFPPVFLAAHAAFCLKDGEAPQVPDYLAACSSAPSSNGNASSALKPLEYSSVHKNDESVIPSESNINQKITPCSHYPATKPLQRKALRRTVDFLRQQNFDFSSLNSSILMDYGVTREASAASTPSSGTNAAESREKEGEQRQQQAAAKAPLSLPLCNKGESDAPGAAQKDPSEPSSSNSVATDAAAGAADASVAAATQQNCSKFAHHGAAQDLGNPLLDSSEDTNSGIAEAPAAVAAREVLSEPSACKKRRGLNTAALRHKNLEQVTNECAASGAFCLSQAACGACDVANCTKDHDVAAFMKARPEDLKGECIFFSRSGLCPFGCCCRFAGSHVDANGVNLNREGRQVTLLDLQKYKEEHKSDEMNIITTQSVLPMATRRKRSCKRNKQAAVTTAATGNENSMQVASNHSNPSASSSSPLTSLNPLESKPPKVETEAGEGGPAQSEAPAAPAAAAAAAPAGAAAAVATARGVGAVDILPVDDLSREERRRRFTQQIRGKTFLAPLTTVGNLPFRRLCTRLGADVTVSEMAVAQSLVEAKASELCLLRRHREEKIFGIQIAAGFPDVAFEFGKLINETNIQCDFVDLNIACPLDQLHRKFKAGSIMLEKPAAVESVVKSLMDASPNLPVTLKVRTAHYGKKHQLHNVIGKLSRCGVSAIFAHGRTAQQRYSKSADWDYLSSCKQHMPEDVLLIGCGDILSSAEYEYRKASANMDALMIGRGALIKPWIFTEIKEERIWDISAPERFELLREFVNNGLEHWGSDRRGVATTRRFLLELLSFTHRYIPPPFLELQPQLIQWRPSPFVGRSDLEVKLSSPKTQDWVEISNMFLGPPPKGFTFVPKHASHAYHVEH